MISVPPNALTKVDFQPREADFSKVDFLMRECLHDGTKKLLIQLDCRDACALVAFHSNTFPNRYLIDLATMFPNLKTLHLPNWRGLEGDIPAPWNKGKYNMLTRD